MQMTLEKREEIRREVESSLNNPSSMLKRQQRNLIVMGNLLSLLLYVVATSIFWHLFVGTAIMSSDGNSFSPLFLSTIAIALLCAIGALAGFRPADKNPIIFIVAPTVLVSVVVTAYFLLSPPVAPLADGEELVGLLPHFVLYCEALIPSLGYLSILWRGGYFPANVLVFFAMILTAFIPILGLLVGINLWSDYAGLHFILDKCVK